MKFTTEAKPLWQELQKLVSPADTETCQTFECSLRSYYCKNKNSNIIKTSYWAWLINQKWSLKRGRVEGNTKDHLHSKQLLKGKLYKLKTVPLFSPETNVLIYNLNPLFLKSRGWLVHMSIIQQSVDCLKIAKAVFLRSRKHCWN